jgi:hypothetical protein
MFRYRFRPPSQNDKFLDNLRKHKDLIDDQIKDYEQRVLEKNGNGRK